MKKIAILLSGIILFAACGSKDKKQELADLKSQAKEIQAKIAALEKEVGKPSDKAAEKIITVSASPLAPQNFQHFVEAQGNVVAENTVLPSLTEIGQVFLTFAIVTFSRIFFRSNSITDAFGYIERIFTDLSYSTYNHPMGYRMMDYYILIILFIMYEWMIRKDERSPFKFKSKVVRFIIYSIIIYIQFIRRRIYSRIRRR